MKRITARDLFLGLLFALFSVVFGLRASAQTKFIASGGTAGGEGSGTVTSVAATVPAYMTLSGSPVTTSGTFAFGFATQAQGLVFASPCSGSGAIVFRALCAADIPALAPSKITGTAVIDSDARLTNARTPTAHAVTHGSGGSDEITVAQAQVSGLVVDLAGKQGTGNYVTALTGDVVATGPGSVAATIQANSVALGTDTTGGYAGSSTEGGSATTADALAANGTNCGAGNYARGVDASGNAEDCTAVSAGSPGGADTQVQYNDGGAFGGDSQLTFNETSGLTTVTAASNDGAAAFRVLPGSGTSSTVINNNGSVTINGDGGTASNPLVVQSGGASRMTMSAAGLLTLNGISGGALNTQNAAITVAGRVEAKSLGLVQTSVKTSAYTTAAADAIVRLDPTSAGFTVTLSSANAAASVITGAHQALILKNVTSSTNTITLSPSSGTIDGAASITMTTAHAAARVFFDGTNWWTW